MSAVGSLDFASLLRRYRRRSGLTQEELAERAGLSAASVSLLERGITLAPQRATVSMLSDALALAPDEAMAFLAQARRPQRSDSAGEFQEPLGAALPSNLPIPLTALIGREREVATLLEMLGRETTRLLTLTGPAGVGKTRLALELAASLQREYGQDLVFVNLIPVSEPERVLPAIAQALGVHQRDSVPVREALIHTLRDRSLVFVLDNFEQVLPAARAVLELLIGCPQVKALVTSRSALNARGEQCFPRGAARAPRPGARRFHRGDVSCLNRVTVPGARPRGDARPHRDDTGGRLSGGRYLRPAGWLTAGHRTGGGARQTFRTTRTT